MVALFLTAQTTLVVVFVSPSVKVCDVLPSRLDVDLILHIHYLANVGCMLLFSQIVGFLRWMTSSYTVIIDYLVKQ